ncbi:hypothetical protein DNTS_013261, partial [Danionella cerebrum]
GFDCPICSKYVCSEEMDVHLLMCFSKPRLRYNDDVLSRDSGECSICLDEMIEGDAIARLPCLCIYHKGCIDGWFEDEQDPVFMKSDEPLPQEPQLSADLKYETDQ